MFRRTFLKLATSVLGCAPFGKFAFAARESETDGAISFFVAGLRYHEVPADLAVGDTVRLVAAAHRGELCYEVRVDDRKIGYAPHKIGPVLNRLSVLKGRLSSIDRKAVPWKRYRIAI